jgi:tRNA (mo5U34)-methyltransferase
MPAARLALGPLSVTFHAGADGVALSLGLSGNLIRRLYARTQSRLRAQRDAAAVPGATGDGSPEAAAILTAVATVAEWYHTIDLGHGVATPGTLDHRPHLDLYRLPTRLDGERVLDVGTFDGFWAFEFERRGAREVIALDVARRRDLDYPPAVAAVMTPERLAEPMGAGFAVASRLLGSRVQRLETSIYTLSPDTAGTFDTSHIGNVLVHLRDPALALQRLAAVTANRCIIAEAIDTSLDGDARGPLLAYYGAQADCNWWRFNSDALVRMVLDAGFARAEIISRFAIAHRGSARDMRQVVIVAHKT